MQYAVAEYGGGGSVFFASGTDGALDGSTSLAWPTGYVRISSVMSYTTADTPSCPSGLQSLGLVPVAGSSCGCGIGTNVNFATVQPDQGYSTKNVPLSTYFYYPLAVDTWNLTALKAGSFKEFAALDVSSFFAWLVNQPWATAAIPNLDRCLFAGAPQGPPALKVPVTALTASVTNTVEGSGPPQTSVAQPASKSVLSEPTRTGLPNPIIVSPTTTSATKVGSDDPQPVAHSGGQSSGKNGDGMNTNPAGSSGIIDGGDQTQGTQNGEGQNIGNQHGGAQNNGGQNVGNQNGGGSNGGSHNAETQSGGGHDNGAGEDGEGLGGQGQSAGNDQNAQPVEPVTSGDGGQSADIDNNPQATSPIGSQIGEGANDGSQIGGNENDENSLGSSDSHAHSGDQAHKAIPIATVGGQVVNYHPGHSAVVLGDGISNTIQPGAPAVTISNTPISLGDSGLVIGSSTIALPTPAPNTPTFTVGGHIFTAHSGGLFIPGQSVSAGGSPLTLSGTRISAGAGSVVVGSSTAIIPSAGSPPSTFAVGSQTFTADSVGRVAISGSSVQSGGSPITLGGIEISLGSSGLAVGSTTIQVPNLGSSRTFVVGGQTFTSDEKGITVSGKTLQEGGSPITLGGSQISLGASGLMVGSSNIALPTLNPSSNTLSTFVVGGQAFTAMDDGVVVSGTTLQPGSKPITVSGTRISIGSAGLIVGTSTVQIPTSRPSATTFVLGGKTFTVNPTAIAISGTSLTEGGSAITLSGAKISLGVSGDIIIGSSTYNLPPSLPSSTMIVDGQTFTINPTAIAISGSTLSEGGSAIIINGTPISLGTDGLVVGTSTVSYNGGPLTQTSEGIGGAIMAGFGSTPTAPTPTATSSAQAFTGGANRGIGRSSLFWILGWSMLVIIFW